MRNPLRIIIEAEPNSLRDLLLSGSLGIVEESFALIRLGHLTREPDLFEKAQRCIEKWSKTVHAVDGGSYRALQILLRIRRQLVLGEKLTLSMLTPAVSTISQRSTPAEIAIELCSATGSALHHLKSHAKAFRIFEKGAKLSLKLGLERKALRFQFNASSVLTHFGKQTPKRFLENATLAKKALQLGELKLACSAYFNIAWEFERSGALELAERFYEIALAALPPERGDYEGHRALLALAYLKIRRGRRPQAQMDFELLRTSPFSDLSALAILAETKKWRTKLKALQPKTSPWAMRIQWALSEASPKASRFTEEQSALFQCLLEAALDRETLAVKIYGTQISRATRESRLNALLIRTRKKYPGLVVFLKGVIRLAPH